MSLNDYVGGKKKAAAKAYAQRLHTTQARVDAIICEGVDDRTSHMLAQCFVDEELALECCENGDYRQALSLLREADSFETMCATSMLERLIQEGRVKQSVIS